MQASLFLIVTLMPAPLPAIKGIWRAHHMAVVPQHIGIVKGAIIFIYKIL